MQSTRDLLRTSKALRRSRSSDVRQCTASASELASTHLTRRRSLRPASTSRVQRGSSDIRDERTARARTASAPPAPRRSRSSLKPFALPSIHETPPPPPSTPSGRSSSTQTPVSSDKTETVQNGGRKYRGTAHTSSDTLQPDTESSKKTNSEKSKRVDRGDSRSDTKAGTLQARDSCSDTKPGTLERRPLPLSDHTHPQTPPSTILSCSLPLPAAHRSRNSSPVGQTGGTYRHGDEPGAQESALHGERGPPFLRFLVQRDHAAPRDQPSRKRPEKEARAGAPGHEDAVELLPAEQVCPLLCRAVVVSLPC
mmetsp:Transcript_7313/g.15179  ORF Transcript_7313/g.15179 Transcript_7313/m.15179 type:complete len:310 (+) Transcript_7313:95-1024(+)